MTRAGTTISSGVFNPDGTLASRTDPSISPTPSAFGYDALGRLTSATSPLYPGSLTWSWRLDGLLAGRTWQGSSDAATATYDLAKRPIALAESHAGTTLASFGRTYDRAGRVTSETQGLAGISGVAGTGTDTFAYDPLGRVTSATGITVSGSTTGARAYAYDADGNRTSVTRDGTATTATYDATDQLLTAKTGANPTLTAGWDPYGDLTSAPDPGGTTSTAYAYDLAGHLTGITPAAGSAYTLTLDALGRDATRLTAGTLSDTYAYALSSDTVVSIAQSGGTVASAVDAAGSRDAVSAGGALTFTLPDLHGDVAGSLSASLASVADAYRYDPFGELLGSAGSVSPWRYQGRLLLSGGSAQDTYDFTARAYAPGLGAFTSIDSVAGSAQDPSSLNRYLYAEADPETLVDPTGHSVIDMNDNGTTQVHDRTHAMATRPKVLGWTASQRRALAAAEARRARAAAWSRRVNARTGEAAIAHQDAQSAKARAAGQSRIDDARETASTAGEDRASSDDVIPYAGAAAATTAGIVVGRTPAGRALVTHAWDAMSNPQAGRRGFEPQEVDWIIDNATSITDSNHGDGSTVYKTTVGQGGHGAVSVVVNAEGEVITVIIPENVPLLSEGPVQGAKDGPAPGVENFSGIGPGTGEAPGSGGAGGGGDLRDW